MPQNSPGSREIAGLDTAIFPALVLTQVIILPLDLEVELCLHLPKLPITDNKGVGSGILDLSQKFWNSLLAGFSMGSGTPQELTSRISVRHLLILQVLFQILSDDTLGTAPNPQ